MKIFPDSLNRATIATLVTALVAVVVIAVAPSSSGDAGAATSVNSLAPAATAPLETTTSTTDPINSVTTTTDPPAVASISEGPSRGQCITPGAVPGQSGGTNLQSLVTNFDALTGTTVTCVSAYLDNTQTWSQWEHPWVIKAANGYSTWVAQEPQSRQLVLAVNLIPLNLQNVQDPLKWEQACAGGKYDGYATVLGRSLVGAGLQNSVIRLGAEMNGNWEPDFIGTTPVEQKLWAKCFDNEVTGLRRAKGQNFLIDWNPNACADNYPYPNYYPGNAYVNIMGIDLYDIGCLAPYTRLTFAQLANEKLGLTYFEAFAAAKGKPMSFPEWGLAALPSGDDPGYVSGIAKTFQTKDFSFEAYFDTSGPGINSLPLGPSTPLAVAAFHEGFSST